MTDSRRLDMSFVSTIVREAGTSWVKFIRVNNDVVVGSHYDYHRDIAAEAKLPLIEEWLKRERFQGAHDHGHIHFKNQGAIVYVYGESSALDRFDSENHLIRQPEIPDIADIPKNEYKQIHKKFLEELDTYDMALERARIDTCRIVAPLFTAVVNNPQIFWSLDMDMNGVFPEGGKFILFEAT